MRFTDSLRLGLSSLRAHRLRTLLSVLSIAIGITSVVLLTSIGEGARLYVLGQFTQFGSNMFEIVPGKVETAGLPGVFGGTTRKLSLADAQAIEGVNGVETVLPSVMGQARVEYGGLGRSVTVFGVTSAAPALWRMSVRHGSFLPPGDAQRGRHAVVLGSRLARELFGAEPAVGRLVRVAGARLRVLGVMAPRGRLLGFDMDDTAFLPVSTAMQLFNLDELTEIDVTFRPEVGARRTTEAVRALLRARHDDNEDFTLITQDQMLGVLGSVLDVVSLAVGGIGAGALLVGAVGILTMMWIAVGERTREIGLLRALGARTSQIRSLFLLEATFLAGAGGALGSLAGVGLALIGRRFVPGLPLRITALHVGLALVVSVLTGLAAGVGPAGRAAKLDPVIALRSE